MVRMLKDTCYNGKTYMRGEECNIDKATQERWIKNGIAEDMQKSKFANMTDEQLAEYAKLKGVDISRLRTCESVIAKLEKAEGME